MTRTRICAAIAGLLTALIVQAAVISPVVLPAAISLPPILVAAVALRDGAGTGIAYGFAAGLVTDLGSRHPAGVLALCWMAVGLVCGLVGRSSIRRDVVVVTMVCTLSAIAAGLVFVLLRTNGATGAEAVGSLPSEILGNASIALVVVPLVRWFLGLESLRVPEGPVVLLGADL